MASLRSCGCNGLAWAEDLTHAAHRTSTSWRASSAPQIPQCRCQTHRITPIDRNDAPYIDPKGSHGEEKEWEDSCGSPRLKCESTVSSGLARCRLGPLMPSRWRPRTASRWCHHIRHVLHIIQGEPTRESPSSKTSGRNSENVSTNF